ncbi:hypothetical protein [Acidiphilium acidophilum]|uniref:hypothetical protein n=1 Tax=Acidiphilium acidophilum TaxID=76588 RepID=UPI002E8E7967|nr:hypothetical protein [Acidiphilium acidophilum]
MLRGRLDLATRTRLTGWAQDDRLPNQPVALLVIDNDTLLDRIIANVPARISPPAASAPAITGSTSASNPACPASASTSSAWCANATAPNSPAPPP